MWWSEGSCRRFSYQYSSSSSDNSLPLNVVDEVIRATINENLHSDCVCFLFQRGPDSPVTERAIYSTKTTIVSAGSSGGDGRFHQYNSTNEANNASPESKRRKRNREKQKGENEIEERKHL